MLGTVRVVRKQLPYSIIPEEWLRLGWEEANKGLPPDP